MRRGLSVLEVVLAALVIGVSAIPVLELMRSSTVSLEINLVDAAARGLAADVLERLSGPPNFEDPLVGVVTKKSAGQPVDWETVFADDRALAHAFPKADVARLLDQYKVKLLIKMHKASEHGGSSDVSGMTCYEVHALWLDRQERLKEVTFARLVEQ
jgi:hypothetical protein